MGFWSKKTDSPAETGVGEKKDSAVKASSSASDGDKKVETSKQSRPLTEPTVVGGASSPKLSGASEKDASSESASSADASSETATDQSSVSSLGSSNTFLSAEDSIADRFGKVRSALGPGTVIQGKLSFDTPVRIDGKLSGEIFSSKALIIGEEGEIDAEIQAACLIVLGKVKGKVHASEKIELFKSGTIEGDITTPAFVMQEGANFVGSCSMGASTAKGEKLDKSVSKSAESDSKKSSDSSKKKVSSKTDSPSEMQVH